MVEEAPVADLVGGLIEKGALGLLTLIIVGLGFAVMHLWKANRELQGRMDGLQEKRVDEARELTTRMMAYVQHFEQFTLKIDNALDTIMERNRRR